MKDNDRFYSARYDGEFDLSGDISDEFAVIAYDAIMRTVSDDVDCTITDRGLFFDKLGLTLSCAVQRLQDTEEHGCSAAMLFFFEHELFDEPICEYTAGLGSNAEEAIINGAEQFTAVVLMSVLATFGCEDCRAVRAEFAGLPRTFVLPCTSYVYAIGSSDSSEREDLFSLVEDSLPEYLGSKRAYWLKLYIACFDDEPICEARLNGAVMSDLTEKLYAYADSWKDKKTFRSEKQFVLLLDNSDEPDSFEAVPADKVIELTEKAILLMGNAGSDEEDMKAVNSILELCADYGTVGHEILAFVPEVYCCAMLQLHRGDMLKVYIGDAEVDMKCSQLRNFGYIEQGVIRFMTHNEPEREFSENILWKSSLFASINDAVAEGVKLEDISVSDVRFHAPDDYRLI